MSAPPIGIKPPPLTFSALQLFPDSDSFLVANYTQLGFDNVLLPLTNVKYRDHCKRKFHHFIETHQQNHHQFAALSQNRNSNDTSTLSHDDNDEIILDLYIEPPSSDQVNISQGSHTGHVIGLISSWIELDTDNNLINEFSLQVLLNELAIANFLGMRNILLLPPKILTNLSIFTNNLNRALTRFPNLKISISLPICEDASGKFLPVIDSLSTWDMWNSIRLQCNYHANLTVSLLLPKNNIPNHVLNRWLCEPVSLFLVSTLTFVRNSKNYPVLNKFNQVILWKFIQKNWSNPPVLLIHGSNNDGNVAGGGMIGSNTGLGPVPTQEDIVMVLPPQTLASNSHQQLQIFLLDLSYSNYLKYISQTTDKNLQISNLELFCNRYFESKQQVPTLQMPLQPLYHDLDNQTYQVFEKDVAKYDAYELLICRLLQQLGARAGAAIPPIELLVVGPGRGPLIDRCFNAISKSNVKVPVNITLCEKNPLVIVVLQQRNTSDWNGKVKLILQDLRKLTLQSAGNGAKKFQIVVSELLGSFGDNELAPECLYPLQDECCNENCIFIPSKITTYIAPLIAPLVHQHLLLFLQQQQQQQQHLFHKPYLVLLNQFNILSSKPQELWTFHHPSPKKPCKKFSKLSFKCHHKGLIHGIIGFFSAELYPGVTISNNPLAPQPLDLISWLPIFFPLQNPIFLSDDQEVEILMRRDHDHTKVWYEWCVESFIYLLLPVQKKQSRVSCSSGSPVSSPGAVLAAAISKVSTNVGNAFATHNSVFGGVGNSHATMGDQFQDEDYQVRVRTGVSQVHNLNGVSYSMRL